MRSPIATCLACAIAATMATATEPARSSPGYTEDFSVAESLPGALGDLKVSDQPAPLSTQSIGISNPATRSRSERSGSAAKSPVHTRGVNSATLAAGCV